MNSERFPRNPRHCRVCLVRHGETPWNAERRLQGHIDIPLNENGIAQAVAVGRSLAKERFAAIYCSDLQRARQTAETISSHHALPTQEDPRLRERHYGIFQGLTYDEVATRHPKEYRHFKARETTFSFPGGGESLADFATRVTDALVEFADRHAGEQVLVVAHGGVLDIARRFVTGKALHVQRDFPIPNAALNWIEHDGERWNLLAWAVQNHLHDSLDELPST